MVYVGETDEQYVARQKIVQQQARERMRAKFGSNGLNGNGKVVMQGVGSSYNAASASSSGVGLDIGAATNNLISGIGGLWSNYVAPVVTPAAGVNSVRGTTSNNPTGADFFSQYTSSIVNSTSELINSTLISATSIDKPPSDFHFPRPTEIQAETRFPRPPVVDETTSESLFPRTKYAYSANEEKVPQSNTTVDKSKYVGMSSNEFFTTHMKPVAKSNIARAPSSNNSVSSVGSTSSTMVRPPMSGNSSSGQLDILASSGSSNSLRVPSPNLKPPSPPNTTSSTSSVSRPPIRSKSSVSSPGKVMKLSNTNTSVGAGASGNRIPCVSATTKPVAGPTEPSGAIKPPVSPAKENDDFFGSFDVK